MRDEKATSDIYSKINAEISIKHSVIDGENVATATWDGGDTIAISGSFVDEISNQSTFYASKQGSYIQICDFTVRIYDYYQDVDLYLAKRVY